MALLAHQPPSFSSACATLRTVRLCCLLKSSSKCFLCSQSRTRRRHHCRLAYPPPYRFLDQRGREKLDGGDDGEEVVARWGPCAIPPRGNGYGGQDDEDTNAIGAGEENDGGWEVGEWDLPFSPTRGQREELLNQSNADQVGEDDGGGLEWLDPSFVLQSQEGIGGVCTAITTAAMEEILAFARTPAVDGPEFAEFLAGYRHNSLSEVECMELMRRMREERLALGCVHLFRWMRKSETLSALLSPQVFLVAIAALGQLGMADEILEIVASLPPQRGFRDVVVYNVAMSAVAYCGRYDGAWEIFEIMEKSNVQPDHQTSSILLNVMKKTNASAMDAWKFFQQMNRKGVNWTLDVAAALISIFCCEGLKREALIVQSEMEKRGILSNARIYNMLINAYGKSNQIEEAEGLFIEMTSKGLRATEATYHVLMDAYGRRLQPDVVELLLQEMQDLGLRPSARSYDCLISAYGRQKKLSKKAEEAFLRMKADGIKPLSSSYTALVCAYAVDGLHEKAYTVYEYMKKGRLKPTLEIYTALLDALRRAGDTHKLMDMWKSMIHENIGSSVTFHMVLDCLAKHGLYLQARDVIYEFGRFGLKPTVMTFNILMNAYGRGGQHYKLPQLLKEMIALELKPDSITYCTIIYAYARVRDFSRAFYYHKQMIRSGQVPDSRSYRKLLDILDVKAARKNIKDKSAIQGIIESKSSLKPRKEKKDEFWKNRKRRSMLNLAYGRQRRFL